MLIDRGLCSSWSSPSSLNEWSRHLEPPQDHKQEGGSRAASPGRSRLAVAERGPRKLAASWWLPPNHVLLPGKGPGPPSCVLWGGPSWGSLRDC